MGIIDVDNLLDFALQTSVNALVKGNTIDEDNLRKVMKFAEDIGEFYGMKDYPEKERHQKRKGQFSDVFFLAFLRYLSNSDFIIYLLFSAFVGIIPIIWKDR